MQYMTISVASWNIGGTSIEDAIKSTRLDAKGKVDLFCIQEMPRRTVGWQSDVISDLTVVQYRHDDTQWRGNAIAFSSDFQVIRRRGGKYGIWLRLRHLPSSNEVWIGSHRLSTGVTSDVTADELQSLCALLPPTLLPVILMGDWNTHLKWSRVSGSRADLRPTEARSEYVLSQLGTCGMTMQAPTEDQWDVPTSRPRRARAKGRQIDGGDHERISTSFRLRLGDRPPPAKTLTRPRVVVKQPPTTQHMNQEILHQLAIDCTRPRKGERYKDPPHVKSLYAIAKHHGTEADWKRAHKERRKAQIQWRTSKAEKAAAGNWQDYRGLKNQGPDALDHEPFPCVVPEAIPSQPTKEIDTGEHYSLEELRHALQRGRRNKAVGEDLVSFELISTLCEDSDTEAAFLDWMERLRCGEELPPEWLRTVVTLLPKTEQPKGPGDLRPISVGAAASKFVGTIKSAEKTFTLDTEWHLRLSWCKLDIRKAFDTLARDKTLGILRDRLPPHMFLEYKCWERLFYEGTAVLKTPWGDAEIPQGRGIRQGAVESPFLFAIAIETALYDAVKKKNWPSEDWRQTAQDPKAWKQFESSWVANMDIRWEKNKHIAPRHKFDYTNDGPGTLAPSRPNLRRPTVDYQYINRKIGVHYANETLLYSHYMLPNTTEAMQRRPKRPRPTQQPWSDHTKQRMRTRTSDYHHANCPGANYDADYLHIDRKFQLLLTEDARGTMESTTLHTKQTKTTSPVYSDGRCPSWWGWLMRGTSHSSHTTHRPGSGRTLTEGWWVHGRRLQERGTPFRNPPVATEEAQTLVDKIKYLIDRAWYRESHLLIRGKPMQPCGCLDMTDVETSDSESCASTQDARHRSRSPAPPAPTRAAFRTSLTPGRPNQQPIDLDENTDIDKEEADTSSLMSGKAKVPAPRTPEAAVAETEEDKTAGAAHSEQAEMTKDDMMAVWQALFDMQPQDTLSPSTSPLLPAHIADNMVETLVDYPEHLRNAMTDVLPEFMARLQMDVATAIQRARTLRHRLQAEEDPDTHPAAKKTILEMLQTAFHKLPADQATSRALQLMNRLQEHDGPLLVDRQALEALIISVSGDVPPVAAGDAVIVEHAWVATGWGRIVGNRDAMLQDIDRDIIEEWDREVSAAEVIRRAEEEEQAHEEARYEAYLRHLQECSQDHTGHLKTTDEDDEAMAAAAGLSYEPTRTRLCVGLCWDDGTTSKAWEWELDRGATLQLHIKMEKKDFKGGWMKDGKRLRDEDVPQCLRESQPSAKSRPMPKQLPQLDFHKPATRELFARWRAGTVSDTTVVDIASPTMLTFFREVADIPEDVLEALDQRDTMNVSRTRDPEAMPSNPSRAPPPEPTMPEQTVPESEVETIMVQDEVPEVNNQPDMNEEIYSNPDPYFNGRKFYEQHGPGREDADQDNSEFDTVDASFVLEIMGYVALDDFTSALEQSNVKADEIKKLTDSLKGDLPTGETVVFRSNGKASLETEWEKVSAVAGAEECWSAAVDKSQQKLLASLGLGKCKVVETAHPYETADHSFTRGSGGIATEDAITDELATEDPRISASPKLQLGCLVDDLQARSCLVDDLQARSFLLLCRGFLLAHVRLAGCLADDFCRAGVDAFFHPMDSRLQKFRADYAQQGEDWLRTELGKQSRDELAKLCADEAASQRKLQELRTGYAEQGEAWLRTELEKQSRDELAKLCVASEVRQKSAGRKLSRAELLEALSQSIAGEQASWGSGVLEADEAASQQRLLELRTGYAEQGEAWLRTELEKQSRDELAKLCVASEVRQKSAGRKLSRAELLEALSQSIAGEQASWGSGVLEADEAASQQRLLELRTGYAEQGEAWLRTELEKQSRDELAKLCVASEVRQKSAGRKLSRAELLEALSQSIAGEQASWGSGVLEADEAASQQRLLELRTGYAEQGEAWLRGELGKHGKDELADEAASQQRLLELRTGYAEQGEAWLRGELGKHGGRSWLGSVSLRVCNDTADEAASQQRLLELRTGYAEQGEAWLRGELGKHEQG
ncbi:pol [Symbiodinium sp. CCMP2592]|nr:pol [Symbiodinium sp. CCMP2592]